MSWMESVADFLNRTRTDPETLIVRDRKGNIDADKTYANITRQEYQDFQDNFGEYEKDLIKKSQEDTSLIDDAKVDSRQAASLMADVNQRNLDRYGASLTPAQRQAMERTQKSGSTLSSIQAVNDARLRQQDLNDSLQASLISIGQGVNVNAQQGLASAASNETARRNAYEQAKAANKAATYQTVGGLASAAIIFSVLSDRRLKKDIKKVGVSPKGTNIYEFGYIGAEGRYRGVMAGEVPWAATEADNGFYKVDYSKVDVEFERVS